jgi:hypothetical protein
MERSSATVGVRTVSAVGSMTSADGQAAQRRRSIRRRGIGILLGEGWRNHGRGSVFFQGAAESLSGFAL